MDILPCRFNNYFSTCVFSHHDTGDTFDTGRFLMHTRSYFDRAYLALRSNVLKQGVDLLGFFFRNTRSQSDISRLPVGAPSKWCDKYIKLLI